MVANRKAKQILAGVHFDNLDRAGCCGKRGIGSQTIRLSKVFNASRTVKNRIVLSSPVEWNVLQAILSQFRWAVNGTSVGGVTLLVTARCLCARANAFLKANFSKLAEPSGPPASRRQLNLRRGESSARN
jgi:hypothetical protein